MTAFSVCQEDTGASGSTTYGIYHEQQGVVGSVTVRPDGTREYRDRTGQLMPKKPVDAESAWDQAVDKYRKVRV